MSRSSTALNRCGMERAYIFIVGLPKTGTKLIISILAKSSQGIYISPETAFVGHLLTPGVRKQIRGAGGLSDDARVRAAVDYMCSGQPAGTYWQHLRSGSLGVDQEYLLQRMLESDRTDREIFRILMEIPAGAAGKAVLGEKTPSHLYHVPTLLEWFPNAKVIHTFRDPRAVLASELRKRRRKVLAASSTSRRPVASALAPVVALHMITAWLYAVRLHKRYVKAYPERYFLSKFEDLVDRPDQHIPRLCAFLGIRFEQDMLMPQASGSSFRDKEPQGVGFNRRAIDRWREYLSPGLGALVTFCCGKYLKEFGYM